MILGVKLPKKIVVNFSDHDRHKEIFVALIYETMAKLPDGSSDNKITATIEALLFLNFYPPQRGLVNQASFGPRILTWYTVPGTLPVLRVLLCCVINLVYRA